MSVHARIFAHLQALPSPWNLRVLAIVAGILLSACADNNADTRADGSDATLSANTAVPVRVTPVVMTDEQLLLRFASVSRSRQRAALTFQTGGVIQQRFAEIGQSVDAGQALMRLYNPALEPAAEAALHRLSQLESELIQAENELERLQTLHQRGVIAFQELEQQQTRVNALSAAVDNAGATLEQARRLLSETTLQAPFAGTIDAILLEPGEYAQPGQPVMRIASEARLETEIRVPAHLTRELTSGQQLPVWASLGNTEQQTATIVEIGQGNSSESALYPVILSLDNGRFQSGQALEVGVPQRREPALVIPVSAVMRSADGLTVFRVSNGRVQRVAVDIEQLQGELAVIRPGSLSAGQQVVYAGLTRLADADLVEVLP